MNNPVRRVAYTVPYKHKLYFSFLAATSFFIIITSYNAIKESSQNYSNFVFIYLFFGVNNWGVLCREKHCGVLEFQGQIFTQK